MGISPKTTLRDRRKLGSLPLPGCGRVAQRELKKISEEALDEFEVVGILGHGASSIVHRAVRRADGHSVALKVLQLGEPSSLEMARHEFETLRSLRHPNIVEALGFMVSPNKATLVLELVNGGHLGHAVAAAPEGRFTESTSRALSQQMARAMRYLHGAAGVLHRDVKPENVVVSEDLRDLRLVDFNVAGRLTGGLTPTMTRRYASPEVLLGGAPTAASDIWGLGLCIHFMLSGVLPKLRWQSDDVEVFLRGPRWGEVSEACSKVTRLCLEAAEASRPTADMLSQFDWLCDVPDAEQQQDHHGD